MNRQRGEVPWVMLAILTVGLVGVYMLVAYFGAYMDNLRVKEEMTKVVNEFARTRDPALMRDRLVFRLQEIGKEKRVNEAGEEETVHPLVPENLEQIEIDIDEKTSRLTMRYPYVRTVILPVLGKPSEISFMPVVETDIIEALK